MENANNKAIPVVKSSATANYPFSVQYQSTENWGTKSAAVTLEAAMEVAKALLAQYPTLPVRIQHNEGGVIPTTILPKFEIRTKNDQKPYLDALWSGVTQPPAVGTPVQVTVNGIGPGVVTGYAVEGGWLGVMVQADEATRPAWHKEQNPTNAPSLVFGMEMKFTMADLYALWDTLADIAIDAAECIEQHFHKFTVGTPRADIWHWFEAQDPLFVVGDVQQGIRK